MVAFSTSSKYTAGCFLSSSMGGTVSDFNALLHGNVTTKPVAHVYICSPATRQLVDGTLKGFNWDNLFNMMTDKQVVSIEVEPGMLEKIPPMIRIRAHILLMLNEKDAGLLKKTDSIKVVYNDYSLYCKRFTICNKYCQMIINLIDSNNEDRDNSR